MLVFLHRTLKMWMARKLPTAQANTYCGKMWNNILPTRLPEDWTTRVNIGCTWRAIARHTTNATRENSSWRLRIQSPNYGLVKEAMQKITGTGRGVGKELAIKLSALGCTVVCWDNDRYANRATMNKILENGGKVYGFVVDVSNRDEVFETASMMHSAGIPDVTILINNQAVLLHQPFLRHDSHQLEETFRVNVMSNFWTIEAFLPSMMENNKGHIVSVAGVCGIYGMANKVPYCASRFAVTGLMEALEEELRLQAEKSRINFTTVYPFSIDSEFAGSPKCRFPYIFGAVSPKYAAQETIKAIGRNYAKYSIPRSLLMLNSIYRILPESVQRLLVDFLGNSNRN